MSPDVRAVGVMVSMGEAAGDVGRFGEGVKVVGTIMGCSVQSMQRYPNRTMKKKTQSHELLLL